MSKWRDRLSDWAMELPWFWIAIGISVIAVVLGIVFGTGAADPGNWNDPDPGGGWIRVVLS